MRPGLPLLGEVAGQRQAGGEDGGGRHPLEEAGDHHLPRLQHEPLGQGGGRQPDHPRHDEGLSADTVADPADQGLEDGQGGDEGGELHGEHEGPLAQPLVELGLDGGEQGDAPGHDERGQPQGEDGIQRPVRGLRQEPDGHALAGGPGLLGVLHEPPHQDGADHGRQGRDGEGGGEAVHRRHVEARQRVGAGLHDDPRHQGPGPEADEPQ